MRDRDDIVREIEDALGSGGSHADAVAIFELLRQDGDITSDIGGGLHFDIESFSEESWLGLLMEVQS